MLAHFEFRFLASVPLRLGVDLFFVLSGFLITRILLRGEPTPGFIGGFYIRRALRLFPLYYLALAVILIFSADTRAGWPYFTFYAANFWVTITQRWGDAAHFWSLAVEEQFYLIWPFVVLFVSRRVLTRICVCLLIASPLFRMAAGMWLRDGFADVLLPGSLDGLACGALLATTKFAATPRWNLAISSASIAATGFAVLYCGFLIVTCALPLFCVLVMGASVGFGDAWGKLLSLPFVRLCRTHLLWTLCHPLSGDGFPVAPYFVATFDCQCDLRCRHVRISRTFLALSRKPDQRAPRPDRGAAIWGAAFNPAGVSLFAAGSRARLSHAHAGIKEE
jgi:peptidoglycan/LPS O-acetylase OafA/YrhL